METVTSTSEKAVELARKAIELKCEEELRALKRQEDEVFADNARRGWPPNNPSILGRLLEIYKSELQKRAEAVCVEMRSMLERLKIPFSPELESKIQTEVFQFLDTQHRIFQTKLAHYNKPFRFPDSTLSLEEVLSFARRKATNEIKAFVEELKSFSQSNSGASVLIQGISHSNIAVAAGNNSSVQTFQTITVEKKTQIIAALDSIASKADEVVAQGKMNSQELQDCLADSKRELSKEKPNWLKLAGIFAALATAIQTVGSLKPAYETLKEYGKLLLTGLGF